VRFFAVSVLLTISHLASAQGWVQQFPPTSPPASLLNGFAYDAAHGQAVLFGGQGGPNPPDSNQTWIWSGSNWIQQNPSSSPPARQLIASPAMVYDSGHQQVVLFGGYSSASSTLLNDTWTWDGSTWMNKTPQAPNSSPPARQAYAMAYDAVRQQVVLYGGVGNGAGNSDTWLWDGSTWTQAFPAHDPSQGLDLYSHTMAFDQARGQVVLFGGVRAGNSVNGTWVWDGTDWVNKTPADPTQSPGADGNSESQSLVYDTVSQSVLLYQSGQIWSWNGSIWTNLSSTPAPTSGGFQAFAYDQARGRAVLFGGYGGGGQTWVFNSVPLTGTISVTTNLPTATFTITGPATYNGGGTSLTQTNAPQGTYTLNFGSVSQYITPATQMENLTSGETLTFNEGIYTPITLNACPTNSPRCSPAIFLTYEQGSGKGNGPQQVFVRSNGPAIDLLATVLTNPTDGQWLAVSPSGGTTPTTLTVTVSSNLKAGTYPGTISISSGGATNSPQVFSVTLVVTKGPAPPPPPPGLTLLFPVNVPINPSACGGTTCTPSTAQINTVFDHQMLNAYEEPLKENKQGNCTPASTPDNWGTIVDFLGEMANVQFGTKGYGSCFELFGYQNSAQTRFLDNVVKYNNGSVLYYDSHPGYDYNFGFGTEVYAAVSGCVSYTSPPAHVASSSTFHILTIIPSSSEPAGGCSSAPVPDGYLIYYLHLSSFLDSTTSSPQVVKALSPTGTPSQIVPCPECIQPNMWVAANTFLGYSGNFSVIWGGVGSHLHFEVDLKSGSALTPVDPYGWNPLDPTQIDPYSIAHPGVSNIILWQNFVP